MYDIVFLSYQEPNAVEHWEFVKNRFPRARRVHGVGGIVAAHQLAATRCKSRYFWVIDADNIIHDDFDLTFRWDTRDNIQDRVAVWRAHNNINGLEYGYGGIKLLPRKAVLQVPDTATDFTTSISSNFHPMDEVASTTVINASPFEAWKAGFRECVKLSSNIINGGKSKENEQRLEHWMSDAFDVPNADHCIEGARLGCWYGTNNRDDPVALSRINDWQWLHAQYRNAIK